MSEQICEICHTRPVVARVGVMINGWQRMLSLCQTDYDLLEQRSPEMMAKLAESVQPTPTHDEIKTGDVADVLRDAERQARHFGQRYATPEHLLLALIQRTGIQTLLVALNLKPTDVAGYLEANVSHEVGAVSEVRRTPQLEETIVRADRLAAQLHQKPTQPEHLLLSLMDDEGAAGQILHKYGLTTQEVRGAVQRQVRRNRKSKENRPKTPALDQYSRDLTLLAENNELDPVIGREAEIETTIEILARRTKNNPVLLGEPGVGKTAIVEGLALAIVRHEVPSILDGSRVVELDLSGMVAGSKFRGEFEERLQKVLKEVAENRDELIVFVDELHTLVGAGSAEGTMDAANALKPALARGDLHLIGATTLNEYQKYIEKDAALERRFQAVIVPEPSVVQTIEILHGLRARYEEHHSVKISDAALQAAAELSERYVTNRFLPDKAIDLVDQAAARVRIATEKSGEPEPIVNIADIAQVIAKLTGVPVAELTQAEREKLAHLEEALHGRIVGQDAAVIAVANAVRRARVGLADRQKPTATFLFLGPTGVGKTELAKALAATVFGSETALTRIDMSEYMESHAVARLIGSPPGYVGYEEGGQLTEAVRRRPYQVILLDEIEKAHPDAYNVLLQLLDDGRLTDGKGRVTDFTNTIVIATSNLGAPGAFGSAPIGFQTGGEISVQAAEERLRAVKQHFRPEFINRLDEIIAFESLNEEQIERIVRLQLACVQERALEQKIRLAVSEAAVKELARIGYSDEFGARELRRAITQHVENPLAKLVLEEGVPEDEEVCLFVEDGNLRLAKKATVPARKTKKPLH